MYRAILGGLCLLVLLHASVANNWGHWRGPNGNSVSPDANPPTTWSETENIKWKVAIPGTGSGSPVVWDDKVFVVTAVPVEDSQQSAVKQRENQQLSAQPLAHFQSWSSKSSASIGKPASCFGIKRQWLRRRTRERTKQTALHPLLPAPMASMSTPTSDRADLLLHHRWRIGLETR